MELLWTALGISVIVVFVFYVLARHWQRILRQQAWTIRRLTERLRELEEVADPEFLRRLNEAAPSPLEQIFTFSFRLSDAFWRETLRVQEDDLKFVRALGSFPASVKIERWRGHTVATITEVLPESKSAGWQTRSLDLYPESASAREPVTLWETPLARPARASERPPSLELRLCANALELRGHLGPSPAVKGHATKPEPNEIVFFHVPLDAAQLAEFRSADPLRAAGESGDAAGTNGASWQGFYTHEDERAGLEWQLCIRDLCKKSEWDRWKILETSAVPAFEGKK